MRTNLRAEDSQAAPFWVDRCEQWVELPRFVFDRRDLDDHLLTNFISVFVFESRPTHRVVLKVHLHILLDCRSVVAFEVKRKDDLLRGLIEVVAD